MEALLKTLRGSGLVVSICVVFALFAALPVRAQDQSTPEDGSGSTDETKDEASPDAESSRRSGATAAGDSVFTFNGAVHRGDVVETGNNSVRLEVGGGSRRIPKRDIDRIEFDRSRASSARLDADRIEFRDGHELDGKVEVIDGGQKVRIVLAGRKIGGKRTSQSPTVVFPMSRIQRIRWKDELEFSATGRYYTKEIAARIDSSLVDISSGDEETRAKAESFLTEAGIFAEASVRDAYAKRSATVTLEERERDLAVMALRRIDQQNRLKRIMPDAIQDSSPEVYSALSYANDSEKKLEFLKAIVPNFPEESVELAITLIRDPHESERVRSMTVDLLRRLQLNQPLLNLYNGSDGALKLVASIALARNRVLLGVPTMIEALEFGDGSIRELAASALRETTGQDFRFRSDGAIGARAEAIEKWKAWWSAGQEEIEKNAILVLRGGRDESLEWKQATDLWKQAHKSWAEKNLTKAAELLQSAIATDPTFIKAAISLATLFYTELDKVAEAEALLVDLVRRPVVSMTPRDSYWIRYELGNVYRIRGMYSKALEQYEESCAIDPDSFYSVIGKGDCLWLMATERSQLGEQERRQMVWRARDAYLDGLAKAEAMIESLKVLRSDELPSLDSLPFARRIHNRTVLDVRKGFGTEVVRLHQRIAKVYTLVGEHEKAALEIQKGIDSMSVALVAEESAPLEAELRNYLALSFERQGKSLEAFKEYRHVLRHLDRENEASRRGLERLQKRVEGK